MVQVETSQLTAECKEWHNALRQSREEFVGNRQRLQDAVQQSFSKEKLQQVEHFHNQFHIQLINIHDLKQAIKTHARIMNLQLQNSDDLPHDTLATHEILGHQYEDLKLTLEELEVEFEHFLRA